MITSKSISTLHYVQEDLLKARLDDLVMKNKIDFYAFIKHLKEDDELKDHIHLYIVPNGRIDTDQLKNELEFINMEDIEKPFKCRNFRSSKFKDWYMYGLHDKAYLMSKGQSRKYHYEEKEFIVSDFDYFKELIHEIDFSKFKTQQQVIEAAKNQVPFSELASQGRIPAQQFAGYQMLYEAVYNNELRRNLQTHDNFDPETGEVIDQDPDDDVPW